MKGRLLADELYRYNRFPQHIADKVGWLSWRVQLEGYNGRVQELVTLVQENKPLDLTPEMHYMWSFDKCEYVSLFCYILMRSWIPVDTKKNF